MQEHLDKVASKEKTQRSLSQAFIVISNRVVIVSEMTDDYMKRLASPAYSLNEAQMKQQLKYIYRDILFTGIMSTIEYNFIKSLLLYPELEVTQKVKSKGERNVHLSMLTRWTKDMLGDFYLWDFCIKLRNDIVHFDSIGRQSMESPKIDHPVIMKQGEEASGNLRCLVSLSRGIENEYFKFIMNLP